MVWLCYPEGYGRGKGGLFFSFLFFSLLLYILGNRCLYDMSRLGDPEENGDPSNRIVYYRID
jgi:hypothetical protein